MSKTGGEMKMEYDDKLVLGGEVIGTRIAPDRADAYEAKCNHERIMKLWNNDERIEAVLNMCLKSYERHDDKDEAIIVKDLLDRLS